MVANHIFLSDLVFILRLMAGSLVQTVAEIKILVLDSNSYLINSCFIISS